MVCQESNNSETWQVGHSCRQGQETDAAKGVVHNGRLRAEEMAEEGITANICHVCNIYV